MGAGKQAGEKRNAHTDVHRLHTYPVLQAQHNSARLAGAMYIVYTADSYVVYTALVG